jgi:ATP:guanido phosphotransferase, N-terminal domain
VVSSNSGIYVQYCITSCRDAIHLLSNHKYLTQRTIDFDENNVASCGCTFGVLAEQILDRVAKDYGEIRIEKRDQAIRSFLDQISDSLLKKHLTQDLKSKLAAVTTSTFNTTLWDVVRSGLAHPDSDLGVYAPDAESYDKFGDLLLPIIRDYHRIDGYLQHPSPYWGEEDAAGIAQFDSPPVVSTRIRLARSVAGKLLSFDSKKKGSLPVPL